MRSGASGWTEKDLILLVKLAASLHLTELPPGSPPFSGRGGAVLSSDRVPGHPQVALLGALPGQRCPCPRGAAGGAEGGGSCVQETPGTFPRLPRSSRWVPGAGTRKRPTPTSSLGTAAEQWNQVAAGLRELEAEPSRDRKSVV